MNNILEYYKFITSHNYNCCDKVNKYSESDDIQQNNDIVNQCPLMACMIQEQLKIDKINTLYDKLYRLNAMENEECIMIKPPKLQRSSNDIIIKQVDLFDINVIGHMLSRLEKTLSDTDKLELYESRLNKVEKMIIQKHEKNLYCEN